MSKGKELVKNTGVLLIGKISTQLVSFLLLPLYTAKLSTEAYGTLDLYTTIANILIPVLSLQLEQAVVRYLITCEDDEKKVLSSVTKVLSSVTVYLVIASLLMGAVYFPLNRVFTIEYTLLVFAYYVTMLFSTVIQQVPRGYGKFTLYTLTSFLSSVLSILFSVLFICYFGKRIDGILLARIIANLFTIAFLVLMLAPVRKIRVRYCSFKSLRSLLSYSIPLVFNQLASWIVNYSDRVIIIAILGIGTNGIYAIANKFFTLITTFLNIYNMAWTESVTRALTDVNRNEYYNKVFTMTTKLSFLAASGAIGGIGLLFKYFINSSYDAAYYQIPILVYAAMFSGLSATVGSIYIAYKRTKEISTTTFLTAIINVIVHFGLIHFIGLYAASISTLVSFAAMFAYRLFKLRDTEKLSFNVKSIIALIPFSIIVLITYYKRELWQQIVALVLLAVYSVYYITHEKLFRNQIQNIVKRFHR